MGVLGRKRKGGTEVSLRCTYLMNHYGSIMIGYKLHFIVVACSTLGYSNMYACVRVCLPVSLSLPVRHDKNKSVNVESTLVSLKRHLSFSIISIAQRCSYSLLSLCVCVLSSVCIHQCALLFVHRRHRYHPRCFCLHIHHNAVSCRL